MAYLPHLRWTLSGYLGGVPGPEIWSTGFQTDEPGDFLGVPTSGQVSAVAAALQAWFEAPLAGIGQQAFATVLKVAQIGPDGRVLVDGSGAYVQTIQPVSFHGHGIDPTHPWQVAQVLTLVTTRHGARGKGRMYLPQPAAAVGTDGRIDSSVRGNMLAAAATAIGSINSALAVSGGVGPFHVAVASSMGEVHPVTQLRMGRVLDTQRRRRDGLSEDYSTVTL